MSESLSSVETKSWPTEFARQIVREPTGNYGPYSGDVVELAKAFLQSESRAVKAETELLDKIKRLQAELTALRAPEPVLARPTLEERVGLLERIIFNTENDAVHPL